MLRITIHNEVTVTKFVVEGKLVGPWVTELEKCLHTVISTDPSREIMVQLVAVTFIDSEGVALLTRMCRRGVKLVPIGCLIEGIVELIEAEVEKER